MRATRRFSQQTVLLVEHNDFIRNAIQKALEMENLAVAATHTAMSGIKKAKEQHFDVLLADYELPDISGLEYFLLIRHVCPKSIKILMTTYGEVNTLSDIHRFGIDDAIEKPFPFQRLVDLIDWHLTRKKSTQGAKS